MGLVVCAALPVLSAWAQAPAPARHVSYCTSVIGGKPAARAVYWKGVTTNQCDAGETAATAAEFDAVYVRSATSAACVQAGSTSDPDWAFIRAYESPDAEPGAATCWGNVKRTDDQLASFLGIELPARSEDPDPDPPAPPDADPDLPPAGSVPTTPPTYSGADEIVRELRALRQEAVANTLAITSRLDRVEALQSDAEGNLGDVERLLRDPLNVRLKADGNQVEVVQGDERPAIPVSVRAQPLDVRQVDQNGEPVDGEQVALSAVDRDLVRAGNATSLDLRADVWFVAGLLLASLFFYSIWRMVMPRA